MQTRTLQKPKGSGDESRRSSTCQPGNISKYSDMLLAETVPHSLAAITLFPPLLFVTALLVEISELEGGFEFTGATETTVFLIDLLASGTGTGTDESQPLGLDLDTEDV